LLRVARRAFDVESTSRPAHGSDLVGGADTKRLEIKGLAAKDLFFARGLYGVIGARAREYGEVEAAKNKSRWEGVVGWIRIGVDETVFLVFFQFFGIF